MRAKHLIWLCGVLALVWSALGGVEGQEQDVKAAYDRAEGLDRRTRGLIYNAAQNSEWVEGTSKVWYRKSVKGGDEFVLVDAAAATKAPAFDHARLAASLSTAASGKYTALTLPFQTFTFVDEGKAIEFTIGGGGRGGPGGGGRQGGRGGAGAPGAPRWKCTLADYACTRVTTPPAAQAPGLGGGGRAGQGRGGPGAGAADDQFRLSPDKQWQALIRNYNVFVRPAGGPDDRGFLLSTDGSEGNAYTLNSIRWSPDSKKIAAFRRRPGYERLVHYIESSPADQLQPKHSTMFYRKPGDVVDFDHPVVFDVTTKRQLPGDVSLFPNPYANSRLEWREDSRAVTLEYNQRGHQLYRVIELDASTGRTRALIEEANPKTFVEYSGKRYRFDVADGKEIIWASERDGWNHLYLYDGTSGKVVNQITKGPWVVRNVDRVDEKARQIWFRASGMHAGKDPYFIHYFRINFDGTGLTPLTTEDGNHSVVFSPGYDYYVDTWSRVDQPPQTVLKRSSDRQVVMELEQAEIADLLATGWRAPEVFSAKGRDGATDIWGVIIRPTNFDPNRKYPVIENIYAGPQGSFVPKTFTTQTGMMSLAELGFIVVQIDGMGTSNRSKAFHDVAWQNLGDAGFPDRILWHKAVAAKYPYYDITRVGIYGTSAGGQNTLGGLLFHPDFYKVGVTAAGCHDNRMDKIWWNEQWMGWPIGPHYAASSNVDHAAKLKGRVLLVVGEMDTNVDPSSTMQVINALIKANKDFDTLYVPGMGHSNGGPYGVRKRNDFFVRHLLGLTPPHWNAIERAAATTETGVGDDEIDYEALEMAPFFEVVPVPGGRI